MGPTSREQLAPLSHSLKVTNKSSYGTVLNICNKEYINNLAQATVKIGLFKM